MKPDSGTPLLIIFCEMSAFTLSHEARAARGAAAISTAPKISAFFINSSFLRMGFLSQNSSNGGGE
ncbi:hypothetical protein D3C71_2109060 [compost metagenome]